MSTARLTVRFDGDATALRASTETARQIVTRATAQETQARASATASSVRLMARETASFAEAARARVVAAEESARGVIRAERSVHAALQATREMVAAGGGPRPRGWDGEGVATASAATRRMAAGPAGGVGGMVRGLGPIVALEAVRRGVTALMAAGDATDKASKRVGISAESWQRLAYALDLSGASAEQLETGMRMMQRSISEGTAPTLRALEDIQVPIEALRAMSPDRQLLTIAEGMARIEDPTQRAAAAMRLFGESGTKLLPAIENIRELQAAAPVMANDAVKTMADMKDFFALQRRLALRAGGWASARVADAGAMIGGMIEGVSPYELGQYEAEQADAEERSRQQTREANARSTEAAARKREAAERRAAEQRRAREREDFRLEMLHRVRLAEVRGERDRAAERAGIMGLPGVEGLGGGDRGRGMAMLEAEERALAQRQAAEAEAARAAATAAETAAERRARAEARVGSEIEALTVDETTRRKAELERQLADYEAAGVSRERLAELRSARLVEIERAAADDAAEAQERAAREAAGAANAAAREAAAGARAAADEARQSYRFWMPDDFRALQERGPRERARARRDRRLDERISRKVERLQDGERVHWTPRELRRLEAYRQDTGTETGLPSGRPRWAEEQDRVRASRPGRLGHDLAARRGAREAGRIGAGGGAVPNVAAARGAAPTAAEAMRRGTDAAATVAAGTAEAVSVASRIDWLGGHLGGKLDQVVAELRAGGLV